MSRQCSAADCNRTAVSSFHAQALCREHFVATCYAQIEECAQHLSSKDRLSERYTQVASRNLSDIADQAVNLGLSTDDLTNLERAQLMDIILSVAHLSGRLRRSPRMRTSIPVRLSYEGLGHAWEEETATQQLSRHGALITCHHPVEAGEQLTVVRLDTGQRAQARVAWQIGRAHV